MEHAKPFNNYLTKPDFKDGSNYEKEAERRTGWHESTDEELWEEERKEAEIQMLKNIEENLESRCAFARKSMELEHGYLHHKHLNEDKKTDLAPEKSITTAVRTSIDNLCELHPRLEGILRLIKK